MWSIKNHSINKEFGFIAPRTEIHTYKYEHEKACADVFVALALTEKLISWTAHKKIYKGIIPDRIAELDTTVYIEMEMGSQDKILQKAENYRRFYFETRENFEVWFIAKEQKQVDKGLEQLRDFSPHYKVDLLDNLFL